MTAIEGRDYVAISEDEPPTLRAYPVWVEMAAGEGGHEAKRSVQLMVHARSAEAALCAVETALGVRRVS